MSAGSHSTPDQSAPVAQAANLPLVFIQNDGQLEGPAVYYTDRGQDNIFLSTLGVSFRKTILNAKGEPTGSYTTNLNFSDANDVTPAATSDQPGRVNYLYGSQSEWHTGVPVASSVTYKNLWDGIDMVIDGSQGVLKYRFDVAPTADPGQIALTVDGAKAALNGRGDLELTSDYQHILDKAPIAFQDGQEVPVSYYLENDQVRFDVSAYDHSLPLIIDPTVFTYGTYLGGASADEGYSVRVDATGNFYLAGSTMSSGVFTGLSGFDTTHNGDYDGFIAKFNPAGDTLLYATYLGGSNEDRIEDMAIDASGNVYVTGRTFSRSSFQIPDDGFPAVTGPDLTYEDTAPLNPDAFVAKLASDGASLTYCGYIGGTFTEEAYGIAVDSTGRAYVVGFTETGSGDGFPVSTGPDTTINGTEDGFIARVNPGGTALEYAGFIGGAATAGTEFATDVVVDSSFNAYVVGSTDADETTFPDGDGFDAVPGYATTPYGDNDLYAVGVSPTGASLNFATYIGGSGFDSGFGEIPAITLNNAGNVVVLGTTDSTEASVTIVGGPKTTYSGGITDLLLTTLNGAGTSLLQSGFIGGSGDDINGDVAVDGSDNVYVSGYGDSSAASLGVLDGPDLTYNGGSSDVFVQKYNAAGTAQGFSGFIGGSGTESSYGIDVTSSGDLYVSGTTVSTESSFMESFGSGTLPGLDQTLSAGTEAFVSIVRTLPAELVIVESDGSTDVSEDGPTSDTYTVALGSLPLSDVTVTLSPDAQQSVSPSVLTFTPANWNVPQTITVTAVTDAATEGTHTGLIDHTTSSADANWVGVSAQVTPTITETNSVIQITEEDPIDQAIAVSKERFADGAADGVVLSRADILVDAFTGTGLSTRVNGPMLLTDRDALVADVLTEIGRVTSSASSPVYLLGGVEALSGGVHESLAAAGFTNVIRLGGAVRNETAQLIGQAIIDLNPGPTTRAFVSENRRLVDSLVVGAVAAEITSDDTADPIVLTERGSANLEPLVSDFLANNPSITDIYVVGGSVALPDAIDAQLQSLGVTVTRMAGADRYGTARSVADTLFTSVPGIVVASGEQETIPGAIGVSSVTANSLSTTLLAGGLAADDLSPLLIVRQDEVPPLIREYIEIHQATIQSVGIVGSINQISQAVVDEILSLVP